MKQSFQIVNGYGEDFNKLLGTSRAINLYIRPSSEGKGKLYYIRMAGINKIGTFPAGNEGRLLYSDRTDFYGVAHDTLYEVTISAGPPAFNSLGTLLTNSGDIEVATNAKVESLFVDGVKGYLWQPLTSTFSTVSAVGFPPKPTSITFLDGYFIIVQGETNKFHISGLNDGTAWDALDFAESTSQPDTLVAINNLHRRLYLFGQISTEVWYNAGAADFPFRRDNNLLLEYGCAAKASVAKGEDRLFWLARHQNGEITIQMVYGYRPVKISNQALENQLGTYDVIDDARGETYELDGHVIYELAFPTQDVTWVYDSFTNKLFERQMQDHTRFAGNSFEFFQNKLYTIDYRDASFYEVSRDFDTYAGDAINCLAISPHFGDPNLDEVEISEFQLEILPGVGNVTTDEDPYVLLSVSFDHGYTYHYKMRGQLGKIGERNRALKWYRLGTSGGNLGGDFVFKIEYYGKTDLMLGNAIIDAEVDG